MTALAMVDGPFCAGCVQQAFGERFVESDGCGSSGIMLVGEGPWSDEIRTGTPFAGAAGSLLDRCLRRVGIERSTLVITNATMCKARRLGWFDRLHGDAAAAFDHCRPHLDRLIERFQPRVIVPLGATAMFRVLGLRGLDAHHGYVHDSLYGVPVVPSYHPSFIQQGNARYAAVLMFALKRAQEVAAGNWQRTPTAYVLDDYEGMRHYLRDPWRIVACDIETPKSAKLDEDSDEEDPSRTIIRASLSHTAGTAVSFPWIEPFIGLAKQAVEAAETVVMHNAGFDRPRLEEQGWRFRAVHDSMWQWHWLQSDLPKGLGFVAPFYADLAAWKHLSDAQPAYYSACDADATLRVYLGVKRDLERQGRWERWLRHCVDAGEVFRRMGQRGIVIDQARQVLLKAKLEQEYAEAYAKLQAEIPTAALPHKVYRTGKQGGREVKIPCPACVNKEEADEQAVRYRSQRQRAGLHS